MDWRKNADFLRVTSFKGISFNAEHYYGKLIIRTQKEDDLVRH
jgi:hypothetical protein